MGVIQTDFFKNQMSDFLEDFGFPPETIKFTDDLFEWADDKKIHVKSKVGHSPYRIAKTIQIRETGQIIILIEKLITDERIDQIKEEMIENGLIRQVNSLTDVWSFLKYTLYHEIGHVMDEKKTCKDCDIWAFKKMGISK